MAETLPALPVDLGQIDLLTPPGTAQRTDKPLLLRCSGSPARFCHPVHTGWRLTCTASVLRRVRDRFA
jgi:hypothetical protein